MKSEPSADDRAMPPGGAGSERLVTSVPVYHIAHRFAHHAGASGMIRLADYVGEVMPLTRAMRFAGETVLRLPARIAAQKWGSRAYGRHDFVMEMQARAHMRRHRESIYHFLSGEKGYRFCGRMKGVNGNRLMATFNYTPERFREYVKSPDYFRRLSHATVVSRAQLDFVEDLVGKGNVSYVPYGVDVDHFRPAGDREEGRALRCVFVGRHLRDLDRLPSVIEGILAGNKKVEFVMVCLKQRCEAMVTSERVRWERWLPDDEYLRLLQQSDLLVLPLLGSTTVTSVLEARGCGVPVVTNRGGISDYLDDTCGVLLDVGDTDGMVSAALSLLADDDKRTQMGRAARERAMGFSWPRTAERMRDVYETIAARM
jgi:glycosyltransferase involved in cell wall biosynthesis